MLTEKQIEEIGLILLDHGMNCWGEGKEGAFNCSEMCIDSLAAALSNVLVVLGQEREIANKNNYSQCPQILFDIARKKLTGETSAKLKIFRKITDGGLNE